MPELRDATITQLCSELQIRVIEHKIFDFLIVTNDDILQEYNYARDYYEGRGEGEFEYPDLTEEEACNIIGNWTNLYDCLCDEYWENIRDKFFDFLSYNRIARQPQESRRLDVE